MLWCFYRGNYQYLVKKVFKLISVNMDTINLDGMSYNELYKLHTGHVLYEPDSDSSDSTGSSTFFEENRPPLYTYEEIKGNLASIEPVSIQNESASDDVIEVLETVAERSMEIMMQKKLQGLMQPSYCYLCFADLPQQHNAFRHYNSRRHERNIREWTGNKDVKNISPEEAVQEKLNNLMDSSFCNLCYTYLPRVADMISHCNSAGHKNNADKWKSMELGRLKSLKIANVNPEAEEQVLKPVQNQSTKKKRKRERKKLRNNKQRTGFEDDVGPFCMICGINVSTKLHDHYQSDLHQQNIQTFCFICNINTSSKEKLRQHMKSIWHNRKFDITNENRDILRILEEIVTSVIEKDLASTSIQSSKNYIKLHTVENEDNKSPNYLQESVHLKVEKLESVVENISPSMTIKFLKQYNRELENIKEKTKTPTINEEHVINIRRDSKNTVKNESVIQTRVEHVISEEQRYILPYHINSINQTEPVPFTFSITGMFTLGGAGILLIYGLLSAILNR